MTNAPPEKVEVGAAYAAGSDLHRGEVAVPVEGRGQAGDGGRTAVEFKAR